MSEWISVEDRLPDENQHVLAYRKCRNPQVAIQAIVWFCDEDMFTHWMPLPDPPTANPE